MLKMKEVEIEKNLSIYSNVNDNSINCALTSLIYDNGCGNCVCYNYSKGINFFCAHSSLSNSIR